MFKAIKEALSLKTSRRTPLELLLQCAVYSPAPPYFAEIDMQNPPRILKPLDDNATLLDLISQVTRDPRPTAARRLLEEELCLGGTVKKDFHAHGLTPHVWNDRLVEFYAQTNAFLYQNVVWNRAPLKCDLRAWIINYLRQTDVRPRKILCFGDGLGFDSAALACAGHDVVFFEPSQPCVEFAQSVFNANGVQVRIERSPAGISGERFDTVVCLDVLEHVPEPSALVKTFADWLHPDGLLITHSPFFLVYPNYETHLRSNQKYSGDWSLYRRNGLHPIAGRFFSEPIVLRKTESPPPVPLLLNVGAWLLTIGRWGWLRWPHCVAARWMSRRDPHWARELQRDLAPAN